uniref:poly(ADP-ribose) glycohydrolase n=1 Tax=Photinus pyralis TaxID=7054 RepID=A0A1Y1N6C5_PHOPY
MEKLYRNHGPWEFEISNIANLPDHTNLHELQTIGELGQNSSSRTEELRTIQLPFCVVNEEVAQKYWASVTDSLSQPIRSSQELQAAIKSYNKRVKEFTALHHFLQVLGQSEQEIFFTDLLPKIIKLALRLPELIPTDIPILSIGSCKSLSISQLQVSSLLANAFLCTFWSARACPDINFDKLFNSHDRPKREKCVLEKIKSLCHYFERVTYKEPVSVITFERRHFANEELPQWHNLNNTLNQREIHITSDGLIESNSDGFLQVDFANKNVGGGVLAYGCVQEEIRFIICPELIVSRLFTEQLGSTEALIITGW